MYRYKKIWLLLQRSNTPSAKYKKAWILPKGLVFQTKFLKSRSYYLEVVENQQYFKEVSDRQQYDSLWNNRSRWRYNAEETKTLDQNSNILESTSEFGQIFTNMGNTV